MFYLILFFIFLFGLIIGSFLNCLIWRLHTGEKIPLTPFNKGGSWRSHCPKCWKMIAWYDNIPVLSFIILRGKCRHCHQPISWQYPIVEFITGILFAVVFYKNFSAIGGSALGGQFSIFKFQTIFNFQLLLTSYFLLLTFKDWFLIAVMIMVFVYDLRWYLILDIITIPASIVVLVLNMLISFRECTFCSYWPDLWNYLASGIIGGSFFLFQFIISRGRWIGGGDIRLGLLMGLALGWPGVMVAIFLAYFMGSIVGLSLIATGKKQWGSKVPFGVFLSTATVITLFWGNDILRWYLGLFQ